MLASCTVEIWVCDNVGEISKRGLPNHGRSHYRIAFGWYVDDNGLMEPPAASPVLPPRRRRRYRHWLVLGVLVVVLLVWWNWPRHYRIRGMAAQLDREEPGWRYDDSVANVPRILEGQNGAAFLRSHEPVLPAGFAGFATSVVNPLTRITTQDMLAGKHLKAQAELDESHIEALRQTLNLRQKLPELLRYERSLVDWPPFLASRFDGKVPAIPRLADWWALLLLNWEEALRGKDVQAMEQRTELLFHYLLNLSGGIYPDLKQFGGDFCVLSYGVERLLAQHQVSGEFMSRLEARLQAWDWDKQEAATLQRRRALYFEMAQMYLDNWDYAYTKAVQLGKPWHTLWHTSITRDDHIEGNTLLFEYQQLRLSLLRGSPAAAQQLAEHRALVNRYREDPDDSTVTMLMKRFSQSGRIMAAHVVSRYDDEMVTLLEAKASQRMLLAMISCERFRRVTGKLPGSWQELIPRYLQSPPESPFTPGKPIALIKTELGLRFDTGQRLSNHELPRQACLQLLMR